MKLTLNEYETAMKRAADKLAEVQTDNLRLRAANAKLATALNDYLTPYPRCEDRLALDQKAVAALAKAGGIMSARPTPETDTMSADPTIEKRDVPARVWRKMAELERQRDEAVDLLKASVSILAGVDLNKQSLIGALESARAFLARLEKERQCHGK